ncbi:MAG TPA: crotonase/enoyl-CoA hydratase family protein [Stellaceae bacterium]|nr:crotonase/enoyl-CoA hydratase family protein [Stellaceae bacterium]
MTLRSHLIGDPLARAGVALGQLATDDAVVELPRHRERGPDSGRVAAIIAGQSLGEFDLHYDRDERVLWCYFDFSGRPCFTPEVLEEAQRVQGLLRTLSTEHEATEPPVRYLVLGSRVRGLWNAGGDLALFAELIRRGDRDGLRRYARTCCEVGFTNNTLHDLPIISIALVQGEALGGGFEAVLSSNVIIAERRARFGLPEILFNLFPGMGAVSFLSRRIAPGLAERMILSGEIYTAEQLYEQGVIDVLAADGAGVDAVYSYIGRGGKRHGAHVAVRQAQRIVNPVRLEELTGIADLWVEAALKLSDADIRKMLRLAAAQDRRRTREREPHQVPAE